MSDWMWFVVIILGMLLAAAVCVKLIEAKFKVEKILKEELGDDTENNSTSS